MKKKYWIILLIIAIPLLLWQVWKVIKRKNDLKKIAEVTQPGPIKQSPVVTILQDTTQAIKEVFAPDIPQLVKQLPVDDLQPTFIKVAPQKFSEGMVKDLFSSTLDKNLM